MLALFITKAERLIFWPQQAWDCDALYLLASSEVVIMQQWPDPRGPAYRVVTASEGVVIVPRDEVGKMGIVGRLKARE